MFLGSIIWSFPIKFLKTLMYKPNDITLGAIQSARMPDDRRRKDILVWRRQGHLPYEPPHWKCAGQGRIWFLSSRLQVFRRWRRWPPLLCQRAHEAFWASFRYGQVISYSSLVVAVTRRKKFGKARYFLTIALRLMLALKSWRVCLTYCGT